MTYIYELCERLPRCGPGDNESTRRAYESILEVPKQPFILDIGCGTGMQTLELARISGGKIIALDNCQGFLDILMNRAVEDRLQDFVTPKNMSMREMDFNEETFDIIWSEGALYFLGFQNGLKRCYQLLKPNGYLAVTELVYLKEKRPLDVTQYFENEYPDIKDIKGNIELVNDAGFRLLSNFTLSESAWLNPYYLPIERELSKLVQKYQGNDNALGVFEAFQNEVDFYKKYSEFYGYEFFVMKKE